MPRGRNYIANANQRLVAAKARQRGRGRMAGGARGRGGLGPAAPMPWDSTAQRESAELGNEAADTRASLDAKRAAAESALGFGAGAGNPYSAAAENKNTLESNRRGITNTAGNQLYAGSTANAQSAARGSYDKQQKALEDQFSESQSAYNRGVAKTARDEQLGDAAIKEGAISRAAASEPTPLGVGTGRRRTARGRLPSGPGVDGRNVRRPRQARVMNAQARAINSRVGAGRGRLY